MARSLNKVQLIGNLTRDPELRYTPTGAAVCTIGLATNRSWTTDTGEKKEETEFHRLIAWNKLAELCSQLLSKGRKAYFEGRIAYRKYTDKNGVEQNVAEIVIDDMLILDSRREGTFEEGSAHPASLGQARTAPSKSTQASSTKAQAKKAEPEEEVQEHPEETMSSEEIADDIPF